MEAQNNERQVMCCHYQADISYPKQKQFNCGDPVINKYVQDSLKKNVREGNCAAKALMDSESGELLGICTYTAYSLTKGRLSSALAGSLPNDIGVVRLVMLGVVESEQKKGYGLDLLYAFFQQVKVIHHALPIKGIYLDAAPAAVGFYARLGFTELDEPANAFGAVPMFLGIQHILAA